MESHCTLHLQCYPQDSKFVGGTIHYNLSSAPFPPFTQFDPPHAYTIPNPPSFAPPAPNLPLAYLITRNVPNTPNHIQHSFPLPRTHRAHHAQTGPVHDGCGAAQRAIPLRCILGVRE